MRAGYLKQPRRKSTMHQERSLQFMGWITVAIIIAAVAACEATKPLPSNLEKLAASPRALQRLQDALEVRP
ncbi:hypothetical protein KP003_16825 [Geomonas nitrogeniifigens]|uniref:hypothetical protein n=1 Tax=Geomonas diazotrophica TaxID=2843197 RepID=UPI001C2BE7AD|nr:hypothetical protein [Geomonas nitrogeniifigens]QXE86006.1 hypothetical protein KP003_16825 [Geomonas nitrogeniifigens]